MDYYLKSEKGEKLKIIKNSLIGLFVVSSIASAGGDTKRVQPSVEPYVEIPESNLLEGFYIGAGVSAIQHDDTQVNGQVNGNAYSRDTDREESWTGATILAGYQLLPYLAIEGRYTFSIGDASVELNGNKYDEDISVSNLAIYAKPSYSIDKVTLYALLGYGQTSFELKDGDELSDSSFQWGAGLSYDISDNFSAFADYTLFFDDEEFDSRVNGWNDKFYSWNFGVTYKF
ncbi:porin family protein [Sulfurovum mangrovi]|uniref:porin family protein n=1 Tax=Sulfurovum mangrovi TaxID=2893889 RepID=UPI001E3C4D14|nr:porin family protein [Sulfurovum mangrovi]UFH58646.1 porin family protein [Sulfurovum mangrovi]